MQLIAVALAVWCAVSVVVGLALGRVMSAREVLLPNCPPDARELVDAGDDVHSLAAR